MPEAGLPVAGVKSEPARHDVVTYVEEHMGGPALLHPLRKTIRLTDI